jgi:hypothetical protein
MKGAFLGLFIFFEFLAIGQIDLNNGLILYYPLDGNATDFRPENLDGIPSVTWTSDYQGNSQGAAAFNGLDTYIDFPLNSALKPQLPVSFSFYVKLNSPDAQQSWIFSTNYSQNSYRGVFCNVDNSRIQLSIGDGELNVTNSSTRRTKTISKPLSIGQWYFVVCVARDLTDMDIYIDCVNEEGTYSGSGGTINYDNNPGSLGRGDVAGFSPYYLDGGLDDFRYWNRALTELEVSSLCDLVSGVENESALNDLNTAVYPNPCDDVLTICFNKTLTNSMVYAEIRNIQGQVLTSENALLSKGNTSFILDVNSLQSGFYYLNIRTGEGYLTRKIRID